MFLLPSIIALLGAASASPSKPNTAFQRAPSPFFDANVIFKPPYNYTDPQVLYARTAELSDGTLLATWENYSPEPPLVYFSIYQSKDGGHTFHEVSRVTDQVNHWGLRYQPFLYELPRDFAGFPKGTVLLAGNSIPTNLSNTQIDLYASLDMGLTWKFVSHVAAGGEALPNNGLTPVWEPFILLYGEQLVIFYSDQRDPLHGQKLVHQTSLDGKTWGPVVDDTSYSVYTARPGMTTVAELPNGQWIMTYEYGGAPEFTDYSFPVYYRLSDSPLTFNDSMGLPLVAGPITPFSSPYVTWSSLGGPNGTIIVSSGTNQAIFVNQALGDVNSWSAHNVSQPVAYTRHLRVLGNDPNKLLIMGAGHLPPANKANNVSLSVEDLSKTMGL